MEAATSLAYLGEAVRLERLRRRLRQIDVAQMAGLFQSDISDVENGKGTPEHVQAVADALGITP